MSLDAETLLLGTGLLEMPAREHVRAGGEILRDMEEGMRDVMDRENPARLILYPERVRYWDRLRVEPDYDDLLAAAEKVVPGGIADEFVALHAVARQVLMDLRPKVTIRTVLGPKEMPLDALSQGRWELLVDVVEGARIVKDLAAGALLADEVMVFQSVFPDAYKRLRTIEGEQLDKRSAKSASWVPEPWLGQSLLVFEGRQTEGQLSVTPSKSPEPGRPTKEVRVKDLTKRLETASQKANP